MPVSEKQRLANQRNALKSTGPKTPEGKARSRRNSLKHGLAGSGVVQTQNDRQLIAQRAAQYTEKFAPIDAVETGLVERAAFHSTRLQRCQERETADLARRRRRAAQRWEARQRKAVEACLADLRRHPATAVRALEQFTRGCDWLLGQWRWLGECLAEHGGWTLAQADRMLRLLGKQPRSPYPGQPDMATLRCCLAAILLPDPAPSISWIPGGTAVPAAAPLSPDPSNSSPPTAPELPDHQGVPPAAGTAAPQDVQAEEQDAAARLGLTPEILAQRPDPAAAREALHARLTAEAARLQASRDRLWTERDEPEFQECQARVGLDTSPTGALLLRYETASELGVNRNINLLVRLRKQEPDTATLVRFEKEGKHIARFWDGSNWSTWPPSERRAQAQAAEAAAAEARAEAQPEPAGTEQAHPVPGTAVPPVVGFPAGGRSPALAQAGTSASAPASSAPPPALPARDEAVAALAITSQPSTSGDAAGRSQPAPEAVTAHASECASRPEYAGNHDPRVHAVGQAGG